MGDILGAIFGSGQRTTQDTQVDRITQELNYLKYQQAADLFGDTGFWEFAQKNQEAFQPSSDVSELMDWADTSGLSDLMSFDDYKSMGKDRSLFYSGLDQAANQKQEALDALGETYTQGEESRKASVDNALENVVAARTGGLANLEKMYADRYGDIMDTTSNYISDVATPRMMQSAVLQGLEGSGLVPTSIARATGEYGGDLLKDLISQYMSGASNIESTYGGNIGSLGQLDVSTAEDLLKSYMGQQGDIGTQFMNILGSAYNEQGNREASFIESLPGASSSLSLVPAQYRNLAGQAVQSFMPIADYSRGLKQQELNTRLGTVGTAYTGIPYTPETNVSARQSSQPLFNFFGQG